MLSLKKQFMVSAIAPFDSGAFVSLLNKGARIDILRVLHLITKYINCIKCIDSRHSTLEISLSYI
jgi:hypothetical protein